MKTHMKNKWTNVTLTNTAASLAHAENSQYVPVSESTVVPIPL